MSIDYKNPFSKIRAEQMGDSAWKYFVIPIKDYIGNKPLIFEGSRGTGKTMFFKCNSWEEKLSEAKSKGMSLEDFLDKNKHIGFYYKADGRFVKSLDKKNIAENIWIGIFNTYFNIIIAKEIIAFIAELKKENLISEEIVDIAFGKVCLRIKKGKAKSLFELDNFFDELLIGIEQFANNTNEPVPVGLNAGTIIEDLLLALKKNSSLSATTFHVFVDEYEVFNQNQQIELNTLLKQSNSDIVYDFGVITNGIQTFKTATNQTIQQKDDFAVLNPDRYGYHESGEYNTLLKEICKKRLKEELDKSGKEYDPKYLDIEFYLKNYGKRYEETLFENSPELPKLKNRVLDEIKKQARLYNFSGEQIENYFVQLTNDSAINIRMHLALLMRKNRNAIRADELVRQKNEKTEGYKEWIHNTETAVIFLLCHEFKIEKKYHGFQVYSALSSGVIRSFLELAEYAFDYAFNSYKPFKFDTPREFTIEEQTKAVYYVSSFKIKEIDSYEPSGLQLKRFTIALGKIFGALHSNSNSTLGEVEHNHFETKVNELKRERGDAALLLKHSIRHKILEEVVPTKTKSNEIVEFTDYHLNHIYCPAFRISHLRKRKIPIPHSDLAKLFCGSHKELEDVVKKLSGTPLDDSPNLFTATDELSGKI